MKPKSSQRPFELSLRIRHPSIDPAEISRELNIEAEHSFRAGAPRRLRGGGSESVYAESYWIGVLDLTERSLIVALADDPRSKHAHERLAEAIETLSWAISVSATRFCRTHTGFLRRLRSEGGECTLLVTISAGEVASFSLPPEASRIFGDVGMTVEFELAGS
ncbi:MAG TPA: hypothetical protein VHB68_05830 [Steroidobacteraceae bacterium]|nr:hypothetical protein [Steroidobacteraceae bacterium]